MGQKAYLIEDEMIGMPL